MANSATNIDTIAQSQAQKEKTANQFFDAASPATFFGRRASTCGGLTWGYYAAKLMVDGVLTEIDNGTLALTASATNYIEASRSGVVSRNVVGFTAGAIPLYTAVAGAVTVTSWTDQRAWVQPVDQTSKASQAVTAADVTITANQARAKFLTITGALTGNRSLIVPNDWFGEIINTCTGAFTLTVKTSGGGGVVVAQGATALLYADGTNVRRRASDTREGKLLKPMADANQTLSQAEYLNAILECTGALTAQRNLVVPITDPRQWTIFANVTGFGVQVIGATGTGIVVAPTKRAIVYSDGTNVVRVTPDT